MENSRTGYRPADESGIAVPSRLLLLEFLGNSDKPVTFDRVSREFELSSKPARRALASRLDRMQSQGQVLKDRKGRFALPKKMDIVSGRVSGHANGFGFVTPDDGSAKLFLHHRQMRKVLHGDRVLARLKNIDERGRKEGVIVEVLVDPDREIVGRFHFESGAGFVEPDDSRYARDITIPAKRRKGASAGDIVVARVVRHPVEHQHAVGEIIEIMGNHLKAGMETDIAIRKHGIPSAWPDEVNTQLESMTRALTLVKPEKGRTDIRDLPLVTIDGEDARDFDDAVYCEPSGKGWRLIVAIADVSHYVTAGTALDAEALNRGNSVYFPNRVVPMLPAQLSNGICSLNPEEDRYCMVCDMQIDSVGKISGYRFYPGLMHSRARLTYHIVNNIVSDHDARLRKKWNHVATDLDNLYSLFRLLLKQRRKRGTIDFEFPEPYIEFDDNQKILRVSIQHRYEAHRLIEECMLAANVCAARFLNEHLENRTIYRNHEGPDDESLNELRRFLSGMGLTIGGGNQPKAVDYARLVEKASAQQDIGSIVQMVLLRSLSQAIYSTEQLGHFALAYPSYTHFTSPIRRYSDLVVHRQIRQLVGAGQGTKIGPAGAGLGRIAEQCSFTERRADDATRDVVSWLKAEFMEDKVGQEFNGVISGVKEFGIFVQLDDIFVDGLVHVTGLGDDYFHFDPMQFQLKGERTGRRFRLGDRVRVKVVRVDLDDAKIDFELCHEEAGNVTARPGQPDNRAASKKSNTNKSKTGNTRSGKSKVTGPDSKRTKAGKRKPGRKQRVKKS